jgi:uncharacterized protein DUF4136
MIIGTSFRTFALVSTIAASLVTGAAAQKYGATAKVEKNVDVAAMKTYKWTPGRPSTDKAIDGLIIAAVDRQLEGVGMKAATAGEPDVLATYYSVTRTDVDIKAKPDEKGLRPERTVGSLVVALLDPSSRKPLVQLRIDQPVDRNNVESSVTTLVDDLFAVYPTKAAKR